MKLTPVAQAMGEAGLRRQLDARYGRAKLLAWDVVIDYLKVTHGRLKTRRVKFQPHRPHPR